MGEEKLLVKLIHGLTPVQLFFGIWILIIGFFIYMVCRFQKWQTQRNFKGHAPTKSILPTTVSKEKKVTTRD